MTIGAQKKRASLVRQQSSSEGLLLLSGRCSTFNSLQGDNSMYVQNPPDTACEADYLLLRDPNRSGESNNSVVLERSKAIGAKAS
ncbi:hypothetical protein EB796_016900 [Bugula neritina]|nr:hypothetical protein EB796_016900 [Bugula neritina]